MPVQFEIKVWLVHKDQVACDACDASDNIQKTLILFTESVSIYVDLCRFEYTGMTVEGLYHTIVLRVERTSGLS